MAQPAADRYRPGVMAGCRGEAYGFGRDGAWERLFADGEAGVGVGLEAIEQAEGHVRVADAIARRRPGRANGSVS